MGMGHVGLTEEEVARRAGATRERVRELVEVGILAPGGDPEEPFTSGDALRVQLVDDLERSGIAPARVATVSGTPDGVRFEEVAPVPLKEVTRPVTVYRALREAT